MKRKIISIFMICLPFAGFTLDFTLQYYVPTVFGIAAGRAAPLSRFEEQEADSRFLFPVEGKLLITRFGAFALSGSAIITGYVENGSFSSLNLSMGASLYLNKRETSPVKGWYLALYPLYELPVITLGKQPVFNGKAAFDVGISMDLIGPLSASVFSRFIAAWHNQGIVLLPDLGIAIGLHFR